MKRLAFIAAIFMVGCLLSCKSKQALVTQTDSTVSVSDTTKIVTDTAHYLRTDIDTTKTTGHYESGGMVEFVKGGGKVSIDTAGTVTIEGIKNIKGSHRGSLIQDKGVTQSEDKTAGHSEQLNGITNNQTIRVKTEEKPKPVTKWYDTMFARIGQGICIALLLWLLFLYLKRKK